MADHAPPTRDEIIALEKSYWNAVKAKDGQKTARLSGDPAIVTGASGVRTIPNDRMSAMTKEGDWALESFDLDDIHVSIPSPDLAVIAYTVNQRMKMNGKQQDFRAADCSTWVRDDHGWRCHAHTETFLDS